jgi:hypothetical protein
LPSAACGFDLHLPGTAEPLPRPTPNPAAAAFDGRWRGSFAGTADVGGESRPLAGSVAFTASSGVLNVVEPSEGTGSVDTRGAARFVGSTRVSGLTVTCTFEGVLRTVGAMTPGTCRCTSLVGGASGTWTAERE